jgi:hypothetical protein
MGNKRRAGILMAGAVALIAAAGGAVAVTLGLDDGDTTDSGGSTHGAAPTVYGEVPPELLPPDPTDVATDEAPPPLAAAPDGEVPVRLTFSGWNDVTSAVEVDGFLPGTAGSGGTCTLTLTHGATTVTTTVPGTDNAQDTDCGGAAVSRAELFPGTWTAVLSYESDTVHGSSPDIEVVVP